MVTIWINVKEEYLFYSLNFLKSYCKTMQKSYRFFFFFVVLGFELSASRLIDRHFYHLNHPASPFFVMGFFELGSCELFAWAGFELQSF
jgi:hypothetical protein